MSTIKIKQVKSRIGAPAAKMMVEVIIKNVQSNEALSDGPACILRLSKYEGAWKTKIAIVNIRVY